MNWAATKTVSRLFFRCCCLSMGLYIWKRHTAFWVLTMNELQNNKYTNCIYFPTIFGLNIILIVVGSVFVCVHSAHTHKHTQSEWFNVSCESWVWAWVRHNFSSMSEMLSPPPPPSAWIFLKKWKYCHDNQLKTKVPQIKTDDLHSQIIILMEMNYSGKKIGR